jgi:hypothetical protein
LRNSEYRGALRLDLQLAAAGQADPEHGIAFGYVMNHIIEGAANVVRATSLVEAVRKSLA